MRNTRAIIQPPVLDEKKAIAFSADDLIRSVEQVRDAVSCKPDGSLLAAAGEDGRIRLINPKDAKVVKEFMPVTVSALRMRGS